MAIQQTVNPGSLAELVRLAGSPYVGAEPVSFVGSQPQQVVDCSPSVLAPDGKTKRQPRGLWVGVGGDIVVDTMDGSTTGTGALFKNVPAGELKVACTKVYAIGTTAKNILFLY